MIGAVHHRPSVLERQRVVSRRAPSNRLVFDDRLQQPAGSGVRDLLLYASLPGLVVVGAVVVGLGRIAQLARWAVGGGGR